MNLITDCLFSLVSTWHGGLGLGLALGGMSGFLVGAMKGYRIAIFEAYGFDLWEYRWWKSLVDRPMTPAPPYYQYPPARTGEVNLSGAARDFGSNVTFN